MALGAQTRDVRGLIVKDGMKLVLLGWCWAFPSACLNATAFDSAVWRYDARPGDFRSHRGAVIDRGNTRLLHTGVGERRESIRSRRCGANEVIEDCQLPIAIDVRL
jgi:hypothetical protein